MHTITIRGASGPSTILVGERLENIARHLPERRTVIITDANVRRHHGHRFPPGDVIVIGTGEAGKTLATVRQIYARLVDLEVDRSALILGIGGGIVCDVAGFAAATYMRGLPFGFVATTLLAQVDASVGGKNGVNFQGYKNMVGVFRQPSLVLCDPRLLATLPEGEVACGLAEIVKHGAIADEALLDDLERRAEAACGLDPAVIERLVHRSVQIKAAVVGRDETETGERRILNFGHTFGHAIESVAGVRHGEAVSAGMVMAARLSVERGCLAPAAARRLKTLLERLHLPTRLLVERDKVARALARDKKRGGDRIHFVLLDGLGRARVEPIPVAELTAILASYV